MQRCFNTIVICSRLHLDMVTIKPTIKQHWLAESFPVKLVKIFLHFVKMTCFTVYRYTWATLIVHMCSLLLILTYVTVHGKTGLVRTWG